MLDAPHGLYRQSFAPRRQRAGAVNADGFGVGWYVSDIRPEPVRYRRGGPLWSDTTFTSLAPTVVTSGLLASVRDATPGFPVAESGTAPFGRGRWLFSHNGRVENWQDVGPLLVSRLAPADVLAIESRSDAAVLWAVLLGRLEAGEQPAAALCSLVSEVRSAGPATLNLLLTDGTTIWASACGESLVHRQDDDGTTVASEPDDDAPGWVDVPDGSLVVADSSRIVVTSIS